MSEQASAGTDPKKQLRRSMGFWDVLLFNIAAVLGPRWIAAAAHNGTSSISLWLLSAILFFIPTTMVINELSSRFPVEGGLYIWSKEAFGDFHGFVAGWTYWVYTLFYFPGLLTASAAMGAYIGGSGSSGLAENRTFLMAGSFVLLFAAVMLNIVGVNIGKWLQNVGGVCTYVPLLILIVVASVLWWRHGPQTAFTWHNIWPKWNWDTVNFWSQLVFAFTGLELVSMMSEEIHEPHKTLPRAAYGSGLMIAALYVLGTIAVLALLPGAQVDPKSGVFQALAHGSEFLKIGIAGIIAAALTAVGNAGGIGSTVAGVSRIPFVVGIDRYLPAAFGKIHPRWKTPYISILVQAIISGIILLLIQINESVNGAYQILVDASIILYFIPFLYMYAAVIKLASRPDRAGNSNAVLIPGGKLGVWLAGGTGFFVVLAGIAFSVIPPGETENKFLFELKLIGCTGISVLVGLALYWRGARNKSGLTGTPVASSVRGQAQD